MRALINDRSAQNSNCDMVVIHQSVDRATKMDARSETKISKVYLWQYYRKYKMFYFITNFKTISFLWVLRQSFVTFFYIFYEECIRFVKILVTVFDGFSNFKMSWTLYEYFGLCLCYVFSLCTLHKFVRGINQELIHGILWNDIFSFYLRCYVKIVRA